MSFQLLSQSHSSEKRAIRPFLATKPMSPDRAAHPLVHFHHSVGNHAVGGLIQARRLAAETGFVIQPKLTVGAAHDHYEEEADTVAQRVMTMPEPASPHSVQRPAAPEEKDKEKALQARPLAAWITPFVQRQTAPEEDKENPIQGKSLPGSIMPLVQREMIPEEDKEKKPVQAKVLSDRSPPSLQREMATEDDKEKKEQAIQGKLSVQRAAAGESFEAGADVETRLGRSKGGGSPLPDHVRSYMEPRFGVDFSGVRVHTGHEAAQMNQFVGAQAFTHGQDIYFGVGKTPGISDLMAHELTHVVQQTGGRQHTAFHHRPEKLNHPCTLCAKTPQLSHACPGCQERQMVQRLTRREECDRQRNDCYWSCTKLHLWRFPPDVNGWLNCRKQCCDWAYGQCLKHGGFPCVFAG